MSPNCERCEPIPEDMVEPCKDLEYAFEFDPYAKADREDVNYYIGWDLLSALTVPLTTPAWL